MNKYKNKGLTGIGNLGNTCYLNSVTQIYSNILVFNDFLDNLSNLNKNIDSLLLIEYNEMRKILWNKNVIVIPKRYVSMIFKVYKEKNYSDFSTYNQNDFMEFYQLLNEAFHNSLKNVSAYNFDFMNDFNNSITKIKTNNEKKYIHYLISIFKNDYSIINDLFNGIIELTIVSKDKKRKLSTTYDTFNCMSLGLDKKKTTINELIQNYFVAELLDGDNMWYNDKTKQKEEVYRCINLKRLPKILCIHLKRFTNNLRKIRQNIEFDTKLKLNEYFINKKYSKDLTYELYGLVMHTGSLNGGHYYVIIKNPNNKWYNYNDTNVNEVNITNINLSYVYCLFYKLLL